MIPRVMLVPQTVETFPESRLRGLFEFFIQGINHWFVSDLPAFRLAIIATSIEAKSPTSMSNLKPKLIN
jgi:hypothetical protein